MTMTATNDRLVSDYLRDVEQETADLPPQRREELLDDLREHIAVSRSGLADDDEEGLRALLHRLGPAAQIADQARADSGLVVPPAFTTPATASRSFETIAVLLLLAGLVVPVVAGLVGLVMAWLSRVWTRRDKLIATGIVVLGGLLPTLLMSSLAFGPMELLIFAPILASSVGAAFAGIFLAVRLRGR